MVFHIHHRYSFLWASWLTNCWIWHSNISLRNPDRLTELPTTWNTECRHHMPNLCHSSHHMWYTFCWKGVSSTKLKLFLLINIFLQISSARLNHNTPNDRIMNKLLIGVCCFLSFLVCYGRVYLLYHSVNQVLMGAVVGLISGSSWFFLVHFVLSPFLFPKIVSWKISEILLIRDTTLIPNVIFFEYTSTRLESRSRSRKKN